MKTSICIFSSNLKYKDDSSTPDVPDNFIWAVIDALETNQPKILKDEHGFYVIEPSENGPFIDAALGVADDWMPVRVYRIDRYKSGGIRREEMLNFLNTKKEASPSAGEASRESDGPILVNQKEPNSSL